MNTRLVSAAVLCVPVSASVQAEGHAEQGRDIFFAECIGCHAIACNRAGPRLGGVIGRPAAGIDDFGCAE